MKAFGTFVREETGAVVSAGNGLVDQAAFKAMKTELEPALALAVKSDSFVQEIGRVQLRLVRSRRMNLPQRPRLWRKMPSFHGWRRTYQLYVHPWKRHLQDLPPKNYPNREATKARRRQHSMLPIPCQQRI